MPTLIGSYWWLLMPISVATHARYLPSTDSHTLTHTRYIGPPASKPLPALPTFAPRSNLRPQIDKTIKAAEETGEGVLVQKNNEPVADLVSIERWRELQS
ncbi:prevent-host-death family protein [Salinibacter ruber]|uniref:Prevent-host-death family protein n=2 Tax=Salinibacter ruber TaxID=146919 RepID=A0A9X2UMB2_9BACT|nr:type II toxin-antitoxin system Phd/YefM family antitoxin [Salinibacter ruber]MCS3614557.1 prevent-host-death family protein [Salinibacter ruber]MCS4036995.1 prevent-host-death family protein [Salinibacter ruber]